ncbi:MAG: TetR/AcrR family transcriptional regulator [Victivallaceae bacterium]|nr:TetR/AcrR family transcriptional regulator [Victivallaceae bacterium]
MRAACKLFAANGFHGTTVDAIAETAGANKQRIYAYFGNKSELFERCVSTVLDDMKDISGKALKEAAAEPARLTEILLREYMAVHHRNPEFRRLLTWANMENEINIKLLPGIQQKHRSGLKELFLQVQSAGALPAEITFEAYIFILMGISYFYHSNRKTLSQTLSKEMFTATGQEQLILECLSLFKR